MALIPENCWIRNSVIPMRAPFEANASDQETFCPASPSLGDTGLSGHAVMPRPSSTAGAAARSIMVLQDVAGTSTLTMSAARIPMQIIS